MKILRPGNLSRARRHLAVIIGLLLGAPGCASMLDIEPPGDLEKDLREAGFYEPPAASQADREADELEVIELEYEGVTGGALWFTLDGSVEEVVDALLDFENAAEHRSWAKRFEIVERSEQQIVARWFFEGKLGVEPECVLVFETVELKDRTVIRYRQRETTFGLAAFFGDYQVLAHPEDPERALLGERVFIDSGLFFVNASRSDIAEGLHEDARRLREWLKERAAD